MHNDELYPNAKRKQRLYQSRQALFDAVMFSYHFQIKGHNKDIIPVLAVIWCHTAYYSNITKDCGTAIKQNSNIYTLILV